MYHNYNGCFFSINNKLVIYPEDEMTGGRLEYFQKKCHPVKTKLC